MLILCDKTTERVALLGGQLCDKTTEKAALSSNMLWSQRPYEVVMSFTRSKPGPKLKEDWPQSERYHPPYPTTYRRPSVLQPPEKELQ